MQISANLDVEQPLNNSRVVSLTYKALAPVEAAAMANGYANASSPRRSSPDRRAGASQCRLVRRAAEDYCARASRMRVAA